MGSRNPLSIAARIVSFHPTLGSMCPFPRDFFQSMIERMVYPLISLGQLMVSFLILLAINRIRRSGSPLDRNRWLARPLQALALGSYTPLATVAAVLLACRPVGNGAFYVIAAHPAYSCTSEAYKPFFFASVGIIVVYVVGLPTMLGVALLRLRKRLHEPQVERALGFVYTCYRPERLYWEVIVLIRRAVMIALGIIFSAAIRQFLLAFASFAFLLLHFMAWPDLSVFENTVEAAALALLTFIAVAETSTLAAATSTQFSVSVASAVAFVLGLAIIAGAIAFTFRQRVFEAARFVRDKIRGCRGEPVVTEPKGDTVEL
jgi:hypothetical protein